MEQNQTVVNNPNYDPSSSTIIVSGGEQPNKKKRTIITAAIAAAVVILGVVATVVIINLNKQNTAPESTSTSENTAQVTDTTASQKQKLSEQESAVRELISSLKDKIEQALFSYADGQVTVAATIEQTYNQNLPFFLPNGAKVPVNIEKSYGLSVSNTEDRDKITAIATMIRTDLTNQGFIRYTKVTDLASNPEYYNSTSSIICSQIPDGTIPLSFSCGNIAWISDEKIELSNNLAEAYLDKNNEYPYLVAADTADIENSPYKPYQRLTANLGTFAGLFYRTSENATWQYFTGTQAALPCSDYSTEALKRAFAGEICVDSTTGAQAPVTPSEAQRDSQPEN